MRRRVPILPTILVALAVIAMIGLGLWQLTIRLPQKQAMLERLSANPGLPEVAFPAEADQSLLFRRAHATCTEPLGGEMAGAGSAGFRFIVACRRIGAQAPLLVQLGTTRDPLAKPEWPGGTVHGYIAHAPDGRSMLAALGDRRPQGLMLVADRPAAGLAANAPPDVASVPNNHLAYGVQWFFFAVVAVVIYVLALRSRRRRG